MAISELTRVCLCHALLPDPAVTTCPKCARPLVPHHSAWPMYFKWWNLSELGARRFHPWLSEQAVWEWLLKDTMVHSGGLACPNPRGAHLTTATSPADLYPIALQLAQSWKAAGSPIVRAIDLVRRSA